MIDIDKLDVIIGIYIISIVLLIILFNYHINEYSKNIKEFSNEYKKKFRK